MISGAISGVISGDDFQESGKRVIHSKVVLQSNSESTAWHYDTRYISDVLKGDQVHDR